MTEKNKEKQAKKVESKKPEKPKFSLSDLVNSQEFTSLEKDFFKAFANEKASYTLEEAKALLNKNLRGVVK